MSTLDEHWKVFLSECVPQDADDDEVVKARMAFYCGASSVIAMVREIFEDGSTTSLEKGVLVGTIAEELVQYVDQVESGKDL